MEPETSLPKRGQEQAPTDYGQSLEHAPALTTPEIGSELSAESHEQHAEHASRVTGQLGAPAFILPAPVQPLLAQDISTGSTSSSASPATAGNDDLIEKEWVDKAKRIIADTREDPYGREKAVGALKIDYRQKRYGEELDGSL